VHARPSIDAVPFCQWCFCRLGRRCGSGKVKPKPKNLQSYKEIDFMTNVYSPQKLLVLEIQKQNIWASLHIRIQVHWNKWCKTAICTWNQLKSWQRIIFLKQRGKVLLFVKQLHIVFSFSIADECNWHSWKTSKPRHEADKMEIPICASDKTNPALHVNEEKKHTDQQQITCNSCPLSLTKRV
jgi:hypothetical protein